jgi:hypothetical protein
MSIQRIDFDNVEGFTLQVNPSRTFISSSTEGLTGSVQLFARSSPIEKEVVPFSPFIDSYLNETNIRNTLLDTTRLAKTQQNIRSQMEQYMAGVNASARSIRKQQQLEIVRFEPSVSFTNDTQRKNVIRNVLYPYYRHIYPTAHWACTNYHTLNFFTASSVPSNTVLLYPNSASEFRANAASGSYTLNDEFTFEFYINPRYTTDGPFQSFNAGTLFHLSSSYAVSLVSGSSRDSQGRPNGFRLLLQVSGGADTLPSLVTNATNLAFLSDDNSLLLNHWHHVAIRWGARFNDHTGSFIIDMQQKGQFVIPYNTITPAPFTLTGNPDVLCIGNFYEGTNSANNATALFFNQNIARREGLVQLIDNGNSSTNTPGSFIFRHPLNAEVHELKIHPEFKTFDELSSSMTNGPSTTGSLLFYVPPFFVRESPNRTAYGLNGVGWLIGGVMQTPFFSIDGTTVDPFNVALSFGIDGRLLNLENYTRDFVTRSYPRLLHLSGVEIGSTVNTALSANSILYDEQTNFYSGSIRKRNVTVLPNDNGRFYPNYALLVSGALNYNPISGSAHDRYINDLGNLDLSLISLNNMLPTGVLFRGLAGLESGSIFDGVAGSSPERIGVNPGEVLTIFQRTCDPSSNIVTFFDISDLFYGQRIFPGSFRLTDPSITGTRGKVAINLRDNGMGSLYRADSYTPHATWNNIGDVFYTEGIAVVKNPTLPFFGKDKFQVEFDGEQNVHILRLNVAARAGEINSSSNPTYMPLLSASDLAHETDARFVYITGLNFHDDNLNVIMKTKLAQPVIKRSGDKYVFRVKMDF